MHGHGTTVYVYLQRLSHLATENIPVYNARYNVYLYNIIHLLYNVLIYNARSSARLKNVATQVHDWTDDKGF